MAAIYWLNPISGSFTNPADWSGGVVPGASDDANLSVVGPSFTVSSGVNETVQSVQLSANATLSLTGGAFTASAGTGPGANAGIILVAAGASLTTGGVVDNSGTIALGSQNGPTGKAALLFDAYTTLTGGGTILLDGDGHHRIGSGAPRPNYVMLYNTNNTIIGSGGIGDAHDRLRLVNEPGGTVEANGVAPLVLLALCTNTGLVEATGGGTLDIDRGVIGYATGVILAGDGSAVRLEQNSVVQGGTLKSIGSGVFLSHNAYLGPSFGDKLTIDATIHGRCALGGAIINNGVILGDVALRENVTLSGDGAIELAGGSVGAPSPNGGTYTLTLAGGTIIGSGRVGVGEPETFLALTIGAAGVIDGDAATRLSLDTASQIITNAGTIELTGAGGVVVESAIANAGTLRVQGGGTLAAHGAVSGQGVAVIDGGTADFSSSFNEAVTFTGEGTLELAHSQAFANSVTGLSAAGSTTLDLGDIAFVSAGEATFTGTKTSGVLTVTDGVHTARIALLGDYLGVSFLASKDGHGGTAVVANAGAISATPDAFVAAMAGFGASGATQTHLGVPWSDRQPLLTAPRVSIA